MAITSISAQGLRLDGVRAHRVTNLEQSSEINTWQEVSKDFGKQQPGKTTIGTSTLSQLMPTSATPAKAPAKVATAAPATAADLADMKFDASYTGMLNNNSGKHQGIASFQYYPADDEYDEELYLILPDCNYPLYVTYADGVLTVPGQVPYSSTMFLVTMTSSGGLNLNDVEVPFNEQTGAFEFPTLYWGMIAVSNGSLAGYYWAAYNFTLSVSDGDYTINASIEDECTPDNIFKVTVNPGADVAKVKYMILPFDADADELASYFASLGQEMAAGTYQINPAVNNTLGSMTESSHASILFASYDAAGNIKRTQSLSMIVILENEEGWSDVAEINYREQLFTQYYQNYSHSQKAMLQQADGMPGYYRIVNPYTGSKNFHNAECPHYLIIDAQDPDYVSIPFSVSGVDFGDGVLVFGTQGRVLGYSKDDAITMKLAFGKLEDCTMTFPKNGILCHEQYYDAPGSWSRMNFSSDVTLTLPEITVDVTVKDADGTLVEGAVITLVEDEVAVLADADDDDDAAATESFVTDAEGKATVKVPFTNDYFKTINLSIVKAEDGVSHTEVLQLNGAANTLEYKMPVTTGVDNVTVNDTKVEYFNLQGMRISQPVAGQVVIQRQGGKVSKVAIR